MHVSYPAHFTLLGLFNLKNLGEEYKLWSFSLCNVSASCHFFILRFKKTVLPKL